MSNMLWGILILKKFLTTSNCFLRNENIPSANREFVLGCKLFNLVIGLVVVDSVVKI